MRSRLKERPRQSPSIGARSSHRSNASADRSFPRFQIRQKGLVVQSLTTPTPPSCHDPAIPWAGHECARFGRFSMLFPLRCAGSRLEAVGRFLPTSLTAQIWHRLSLRQKVARFPAVRQPAGPALVPSPETAGIVPSRPSHSSFVHHRRSEATSINSNEPVPGFG